MNTHRLRITVLLATLLGVLALAGCNPNKPAEPAQPATPPPTQSPQ